jgi:hypothetical protein
MAGTCCSCEAEGVLRWARACSIAEPVRILQLRATPAVGTVCGKAARTVLCGGAGHDAGTGVRHP